MIRINSIELKDFGRHRHIKHTCDGYVIGLAGPNGRGKSTVLQALQYALTGTIDHPDPMPAFIRRTTGEAEPKSASVVVHFEADGKPGRITRKVTRTSSSRELLWDGSDKPVTADKSVAAALMDILGVDKRAINSTVFIRQGEMTNMFGRDVERREFYTRLLMLGHMDKIAGIVDTYRKQLSDTIQDLTPAKDEATLSLQNATLRFEQAEARLKAAVDPASDLDCVRQLTKAHENMGTADDALIDARNALKAAEQAGSLEELQAQLKMAELAVGDLIAQQTRQSKAVTRLMNAELRIAELRRTLDLFLDLDTKKAAVDACAAVSDTDPGKELPKLYDTMSKLMRKATAEAGIPAATAEAERTKQDVDVHKAKLDEISSAQSELRDRIAPLRDALQLRTKLRDELAGCHVANCPVCGSGSPDSGYLERTIRELSAEIRPLEGRVADLAHTARACTDELRVLLGEQTKADTKLHALTEEAKRLRAELVLVNEAALTERIKEVEAAASEWAVAQRQRADATVAHDRALALVTGKARPTDNDIAAAEAELQEATGEHFELPADFAANLTVAQGRVTTIQTSLQQVTNRQAILAQAQQSADTAAANMDALVRKVSQANPGLFARCNMDGVVTLTNLTELQAELALQQQAYDTLRGERNAAMTAVNDAEKRLGEIELRMSEQVHRRNLIDDLVAIRDTFKPDGATIEYLDYKFGQIATLAAEYLAESQADFMVAASTDAPLAFDFLRLDRPGEVWLPQSRMSGGQKVRLAVATLRAIHALVLPNVGLLVLDEPTTHLDDEAKRSMAEMLRKIGDEGVLQMIVCDHSPELLDAFSDTINIPE